MKTDKEKLIELLTEFGVGFELEENDILCREGRNKIDGYMMFVTSFDFDENGKFIKMGAWE